MSKPTKNLIVPLPANEHQAFKRVAASKDLSMSQIIRRVIRQEIQGQKNHDNAR